MRLYPFYIIFWSGVAAFLFLWPAVDANAPPMNGWIGISPGWIALVLALVNVARWWSWRSYQRHHEQAREAAARLRQRSPAVPPADRPRDPTFDFGAEPDAPPDEPPPG
jgi:hypothetical protein